MSNIRRMGLTQGNFATQGNSATQGRFAPLRAHRADAFALHPLSSVAPSPSVERHPTRVREDVIDADDEMQRLDELIRYLDRLPTEVIEAVLGHTGDAAEPEVLEVIRHLEVQPAERVEMALLSQVGPSDPFSVLVYLQQSSTDQEVRERARRAIKLGMERLVKTVLGRPEDEGPDQRLR